MNLLNGCGDTDSRINIDIGISVLMPHRTQSVILRPIVTNVRVSWLFAGEDDFQYFEF